MAKMFYNIDEAAERLGIKPQAVSKLVEEGKLQQFRDRDKLMFKRDQIDEMASLKDTIKLGDIEEDGGDGLGLDDTVDALSTKTDKIELISDDAGATDAGGSSYELVLEEDEGVKKGDTDLMGEDIDPTKIAETGAMELSDSTASGGSAVTPAPKGKPAPKVDKKVETSPIFLEDEAGMSGADTVEAMDIEELEELNLEDEAAKTRGPSGSGSRTGVNIFDTQEIEAADSMARTHVTKAFKDRDEEEDLNLESVGSGSGLLDLTREADDTSLGAVELLDEVAPAGDTAAGGTIGGSIPGSSTGIFEGAAEGGAEPGTSGSIVAVEEGMAEEPEMVVAYAGSYEEADVFGGLTLMGVFAVLVLATIVAITGFQGQIVQMTEMFVTPQKDPNRLMMVMGGLAVVLIILLVVDFVMGKKRR